MKTVKLLQTTVIGVAAAMMLSACGEDATDGVITPPSTSSGQIYTKDEALTILIKSVEYLSVFDLNYYVDVTKAGTNEPIVFNCDTTTTGADIAYTDEGFIIVLGPITDCVLNGIELNTESRVVLTYKTVAQPLPTFVYSIDDTTNISVLYDDANGDYIGYFDGVKIVLSSPSSQTLVQSMVMGNTVGGVNTLSTGLVQRIDTDENGQDTLAYQYELTNQVGSSLFFTDTVSAADYEYVIQ